MNLLDPFDFGLTPRYKKFSPVFNLISLTSETSFDVESGHWKGWVYMANLTNRNYKQKSNASK